MTVGSLIGVIAFVGVIAAILLAMNKKMVPGVKPITGTVTDIVQPAPAGSLGVFLGMKLDVDLLSEGGITHFQTCDRKVGCDVGSYHLGLQPSPFDPVEVCMKAVHRESGRSMPIYIDGTALQCDERWTDADSFYFYPLSHRPGEGKPTNCNPAIQAMYDKAAAEFQAAQAALDARKDPGLFSTVPMTTPNPVGVVASTTVAAPGCCGNVQTLVVNVPKNAEHVDFEFWFRSKEHPEIVSHWRQTVPVMRTGCQPAS